MKIEEEIIKPLLKYAKHIQYKRKVNKLAEAILLVQRLQQKHEKATN